MAYEPPLEFVPGFAPHIEEEDAAHSSNEASWLPAATMASPLPKAASFLIINHRMSNVHASDAFFGQVRAAAQERAKRSQEQLLEERKRLNELQRNSESQAAEVPTLGFPHSLH